MAHTYAVILAGGRGLRLNSLIPKQFLPLGGIPVIAWSLLLCESLSEIDRILLVSPEDCIDRAGSIAAQHDIKKIVSIIPGGATRQQSGYNAIKAADYSDADILLFHDAARPFVSPDIVRRCIIEAGAHGAAAVYSPVNDTIAEISDNFVVSVPPRERMYFAQTPQGFRFSTIREAHERATQSGASATDDVSLVLNAGFRVRMVEGDHSNFKITTDLDYQNACRIAETVDSPYLGKKK